MKKHINILLTTNKKHKVSKDFYTVLVTGGLGFIGSHTILALINDGYNVICIDNLMNSHLQIYQQIKKLAKKNFVLYKQNINNQSALKKIVEKHSDIKAIIHFAALKSVNESVSNPLIYYQNNITPLLNLLTVTNNIPIIFSSSCTVYDPSAKIPVDENCPIGNPQNPYGNTKIIGENILKDFASAKPEFSTISLRYFNPIGADKSGEIGELPLQKPNNLIPTLTQSVAGLLPAIKIFGKNYNTPDGTCIRDYIHITDLAQGHIKAMERILNKKQKNNFEYFNLGTGKGYSVKEVIDTFEKVTGEKVNYIWADKREGDIEKIWACTKIANSELGWRAKKNLDEMLLSAWKWQCYIIKNKALFV